MANMLTKLLPYALLTFVGIAGWSMNSAALLTVVVLGTAGVAIGTSLAGRPIISSHAPVVDVATLEEYEARHHEHPGHQDR